MTAMTGLLDLVITRLAELTAGQQFYDPALQAQGDPRLYKWALPPKRTDAAAGQDFPFIVARIRSGRSDQHRDSIIVRLYCGLRTDGDEAAGNADIQRLADLLLPITSSRSWPPIQPGPAAGLVFRRPRTWGAAAPRLFSDHGPDIPGPCNRNQEEINHGRIFRHR